MEDMILSEAEEASLKSRLFTGRIIWGSLIWGELIFLALALYLQGKRESTMDKQGLLIMLLIGLVMVVGGLAAAVGIRMAQVRLLRSTENLGQGSQRIFSSMVVSMAILEGGCFFCMVQILIGQRLDVMLVLVGLALLGQMLHFPTRGRWLEVWRESRQEQTLSKQ